MIQKDTKNTSTFACNISRHISSSFSQVNFFGSNWIALRNINFLLACERLQEYGFLRIKKKYFRLSNGMKRSWGTMLWLYFFYRIHDRTPQVPVLTKLISNITHFQYIPIKYTKALIDIFVFQASPKSLQHTSVCQPSSGRTITD